MRLSLPRSFVDEIPFHNVGQHFDRTGKFGMYWPVVQDNHFNVVDQNGWRQSHPQVLTSLESAYQMADGYYRLRQYGEEFCRVAQYPVEGSCAVREIVYDGRMSKGTLEQDNQWRLCFTEGAARLVSQRRFSNTADGTTLVLAVSQYMIAQGVVLPWTPVRWASPFQFHAEGPGVRELFDKLGFRSDQPRHVAGILNFLNQAHRPFVRDQAFAVINGMVPDVQDDWSGFDGPLQENEPGPGNFEVVFATKRPLDTKSPQQFARLLTESEENSLEIRREDFFSRNKEWASGWRVRREGERFSLDVFLTHPFPEGDDHDRVLWTDAEKLLAYWIRDGRPNWELTPDREDLHLKGQILREEFQTRHTFMEAPLLRAYGITMTVMPKGPGQYGEDIVLKDAAGNLRSVDLPLAADRPHPRFRVIMSPEAEKGKIPVIKLKQIESHGYYSTNTEIEIDAKTGLFV